MDEADDCLFDFSSDSLSGTELSYPVAVILAGGEATEEVTHLLELLPREVEMSLLVVSGSLFEKGESLRERFEERTGRVMEMVGAERPLEQVVEGKVYLCSPVALVEERGGALWVGGAGGSAERKGGGVLEGLARLGGRRVMAVCLSGCGEGGEQGIVEIRRAGGIVLATGVALEEASLGGGLGGLETDCTGSMEEIADKLQSLVSHMYLCGEEGEEGEEAGEQGDMPALSASDPGYRLILNLLRSETGVDFSDYRDKTIRRRIARRMALRGMERAREYLGYLDRNRTEVDALYRDILINVTSFFRNPAAYEALKEFVFPRILKDKSPESPVRIWVPGCSTGQEVYSIAIALLEYLDGVSIRPPIQIFGTDLSDAAAINRARSGLYPIGIEAEVSEERLRRFFTKEEGGYRIGRSIRDACIFARQNVVVDPPFSRMDLISCRNLLIYLSQSLQRRVIPSFHYALSENGFLLLGASESIGRFTDLFVPVDSKNRIYTKVSSAGRGYPRVAHLQAEPVHGRSVAQPERSGSYAAELQREAERVLLSRFSPAGVLVGEDYEVIQFRGRTGQYLEPSSGEATFNVLRMARESLFSPMRAALEEVRSSGVGVRRSGIYVRDGAGARFVDLEVLPVRLPGAATRGYLVLFEPSEIQLSPGEGAAGAASSGAGSEEEVEQLRDDLAHAKEYLQSIIEQQSASNEELRSANEEILSANEELQSANEELLTSKEELQSTNEEILTINQELQTRNEELATLNDDLVNLLSSVRIPLVIFDTQLCVRRFTPAAAKSLKLMPMDVGRSISTIRFPLSVPHIEDMVSGVIVHGQQAELEVRDSAGHWYLLRIHPYRTSDNRVEGAVAVLVDIDEVRSAREKLREVTEYSQAILDTTPLPLLILDAGLHVLTVNRAFEEKFESNASDFVDEAFEKTIGRLNCPGLQEWLWKEVVAGADKGGARYEREFSWPGHRTFLLNARWMPQKDNVPRILLSFLDVSEQRELESLNRQRLIDLSAASVAKDQFLAMLSHELRTPLTPVLLAVSSLESRTGLPREFREEIAMIRRNVEVEAQLIDDLLDLTRLGKGKLQIKARLLNAISVLNQALEVVQTKAVFKSIRMDLEDSSTNSQVNGDRKRLKQVFWNLLSNAIKFSASGGTIRVKVFNPSESTLRFVIEDDGVGIEPEMVSKIFGAFEQGMHHGSEGGLGLGLAIAKSIVLLHQGVIWAESAGLNHGASFFIELPTAVSSGESAIAEGEQPSLSERKYRVLLVEDHFDTASVLARLITKMGCEVTTAHSLAEVQSVISNGRFDLLVSDIGLPDGSGLDVMMRLRELYGIQGLALTGMGSEADRTKILQAGFSECLVKPVDFTRLKMAIERILNLEG